MKMSIHRRGARLGVVLVLFIVLAACSGLGGEPEIMATLPPPATQSPDTTVPQMPPDVMAGAQIFAARCTACHGPMGDGQGPLVTSGEIPESASFTDPTTARDQTPRQWYETITNGRIDALMPPWRDALSPTQRWQVALYTYTLHYTPDAVSAGEVTWATLCAEDCDTLPGIGNLSDLAVMVDTSDADLRAALPDSLTDDEAWQVVTYLRAQSVENSDVFGQPPPAQATATPAATSVPAAPGVISGQVRNGTVGATLPDNLTVVLYVWDTEFNLTQLETPLLPDGTYRFEDVSLQAEYAYAVAVAYEQRRFASEIVRGAALEGQTLDITLFEITDDPGVLTVTGLVNQVTAVGGGLQIVQVMNIRNTSDRAYSTSNQIGEQQFASVILSLPPAASILGFPNGEQRFVVSEDQTTVVDTIPVLPGEDHIIQMVYLVPYEDGAIIEYPINYALTGQVRLLLRPENLVITGDTYQPIGQQQIGSNTYAGYGAALALTADDVISFEVRGQPAESAAQLSDSVITGNNVVLVIGGALLGIALVVAVLFVVMQRRSNKSTDRSVLIDAIVRQLAELDTAHEQGQLNHDVYQRQRQQLKQRLAELLGDEDA